MYVGSSSSGAATAATLLANPRTNTAERAAQAAQTDRDPALVLPPDFWEQLAKAKAWIAAKPPQEQDRGAFRPDQAGLSVTGDGMPSAQVSGSAVRDPTRAAPVSLRMDGAAARLEGEVSGAAEVGLHRSSRGGSTASLRVRTGEGGDAVSLALNGEGDQHLSLDTNGGNDTVSISGSTHAFIGVDAGAGNDTVSVLSAGGLQHLSGGAGNDIINLHNGSGAIYGGAGDDRINLSWDETAGAAKHRIVTLRGVTFDGREVVLQKTLNQNAPKIGFGKGDGHDIVTMTAQGGAQIQNRAAVSMQTLRSDEVEVVRDGADLVLRVRGTEDSFTLRDYDPRAWGLIQFRDGVRHLSDIVAEATKLDATA